MSSMIVMKQTLLDDSGASQKGGRERQWPTHIDVRFSRPGGDGAPGRPVRFAVVAPLTLASGALRMTLHTEEPGLEDARLWAIIDVAEAGRLTACIELSRSHPDGGFLAELAAGGGLPEREKAIAIRLSAVRLWLTSVSATGDAGGGAQYDDGREADQLLTLSQLAFDVAHGTRRTLSAIIACTELLRRRLSGDDDAVVTRYLDTILAMSESAKAEALRLRTFAWDDLSGGGAGRLAAVPRRGR